MKTEFMMNTIPVSTGEEDNYSIEVVEHKPFPGDFQTASMTTVKLADIISSFFKPVFSDYAGCRVRVYSGNPGNDVMLNGVYIKPTMVNPAAVKMNLPIGAVYVDLFFRDNAPSDVGVKSISLIGGSKPKAKPEVKKSGNKKNPAENLAARFMSQNKMSSLAYNGINYEVNEKTYQMLEQFRFNYNGIRPVRWADLKSEIITGMHPNSPKNEALVCISCLDVNAIVSAIFGTEGEGKKNKYAYTVTPAASIGLNDEYLVHIVQMDTDVVERTSAELGLHNVNNIGFHSC